jgi:hypothetical protein
MDKNELKAGGISYNSFGSGNAKNKSIDLGFDSLKIYDRTFHKKKLAAFDNIELTAAQGFTYPDTMLLIPATKIKCDHDNEMKDRFRMRYLQAPQGEGLGAVSSREYYEIRTGGLAERPTDKNMKMDISYTTWQGTEFLGLEHFGINSL